MFVCEYCDKELSSKFNLKTHQTKAKYCLEKQKGLIVRNICIDYFDCKFCDKKFIHGNKKNEHHL